MEIEQPKSMTGLHQKLIEILEWLDLTIRIEEEFPPKCVDCYLPDYHIAVEADGPQHSISKDMDRDAYLMSRYALPVIRMNEKDLSGGADVSARRFLLKILDTSWGSTVVERRMIAWKEGALIDS